MEPTPRRWRNFSGLEDPDRELPTEACTRADEAEAGGVFLSQVLAHMGERQLMAAIVRKGPGQACQVDQLVRLAGGLAVHVHLPSWAPTPAVEAEVDG